VPNARLYITHDPELDWLIALEFGRVDDGQPSENWVGITDEFGFLHDGPGGPALGFKVLDFSEFDVENPEVHEIWSEPRFDVPLLGITDACAGEIIVGARAHFGDEPSTNRVLFDGAASESGEAALTLWRACLESGDSMAHFGLGYTLYDLGRCHEAYGHLRHYVEIAPAGSWNWCWFGRAAQAIGEFDEARDAYERAIELEEADGDETDASDRLADLVVDSDWSV
jgi:tetratricopeptide (TPR) repeat protein